MNSVIREENWEFSIVTVPLRRKRLLESKNSFFDIFIFYFFSWNVFSRDSSNDRKECDEVKNIWIDEYKVQDCFLRFCYS